MDVLEHTKRKMQTALEHLKTDLKGLRTGRANPAMLDQVTVEAYGSQMRLKELASISVPDAKQLLITPFDNSNLHLIKKGLEAANLNLAIIVDGHTIRLKIPDMDANVRQEMVKLAKKKCEEAKVSIRNIRREANDSVKKQKADGDIPEDVLKKLEKHIQELTDKSCKSADEITEQKEKEILTV